MAVPQLSESTPPARLSDHDMLVARVEPYGVIWPVLFLRFSDTPAGEVPSPWRERDGVGERVL